MAGERQPSENSPLLEGARDDERISETATEETPIIATELTGGKLALVLGSAWVGVFVASLDATVITTLLAPISSTFDSFAQISWIATAYLIAQAAFQPLLGKLTDIYGRRECLIVCNVAFFVGTAMCGLANSQGTMIAGRIVAGCGGGGLSSISSILCSDLVSLRKRGLLSGWANLVWGAGGSLGGLYGGFMSDRFGWRYAFLLQLPVIFIAGVLVSLFVRVPKKESGERKHRRVDYLGSATLVTSLVLFLLAMNTGGNIVPWSHPIIWICLPLSAACFGGFLTVEKRFAKEPIIPLEILGTRTVAAACASFFFMVFALYSMYFFAPLYFMLSGESATVAGLRLVPFTVGVSMGSLGAGFIMRKTGRYYYIGITAAVLMNAGLGLVASFNLQTPRAAQYLSLLLVGIGYGAELTSGQTAMIAAVDHAHLAVTTSASYLFRSVGSTLGAAAGSAVFQNVLKTRLAARLETLGDPAKAEEVRKMVTRDFDKIFQLSGRWKEQVMAAFMDSLHAVFLLSLGIGLLTIITVGIMREHKLHSTLDRK